MTTLALALLGPLEVLLDGTAVTAFESDRVRALLAYLAVERGRPHRRETLAELLWPDQSEEGAMTNLRQALSRLRRAIRDQAAQPPLLEITRQTIQVNPATVQLDVAQFTDLLSATQRHRHRRIQSCQVCRDRLTQAVELYRGDFLQGFGLDNTIAFEDWLLSLRLRLREQMVAALAQLVAYYAWRGEDERVRSFATQLVGLEPWNEEAHRQLMRAYVRSGQRGVALAQYETCRRVLHAEFRIEPGPETVALWEQIRQGNSVSLPHDVPKHNLPMLHTPSFGREAEMTRIMEHLVDPHYRLLTLLGPGGMGKTHVAIAAAWQQVGAWRDGVWWVPLAGVESVEGLVLVVAQVLGLDVVGRKDAETQVMTYLRSRELLLVLDNFEQIQAGADWVLQVLERAPQVAVVVTSRTRLQLQAEYVVGLTGLPIPASPLDLNAASHGAVQLFAERADRLPAGFALTAITIGDVVHLCQLVGGMPLAIELAAAALDITNTTTLVQALQRRLDVLRSTLRDVPERHKDLRVIFDYAWSALPTSDQQCLARLAVFVGKFPFDAAQSVVDTTHADLARFAAKALINEVAPDQYEFHEVLRHFAHEQLVAQPSAYMEAYTSLAEHYASFLAEREPLLRGPQQQATLRAINGELRHVQHAWDWVVQQRQYRLMQRMLPLLGACYAELQQYRDGQVAFATAAHALAITLEAVPAAMSAEEVTQIELLWGQALAHQGNFCLRRGELPQSAQLLEQSLRVLRPLDAVSELLRVLNWLGLGALYMGNHAVARRWFDEALALNHHYGDDIQLAATLNHLGGLTATEGNYDQASGYIQRALDIYQARNDQPGMLNALNNLGTTAYYQGDYAQAEHYFRQCLTLSEAYGHTSNVGFSHNNLGDLQQLRGNNDAARAHFEQGLATFRAIGDTRGIAFSLNDLGQCLMPMGDKAAAKACFAEALALAVENHLLPQALTSMVGLAGILAQAADKDGQTDKMKALEVVRFVLAQVVLEPETQEQARELQQMLVAELEGMAASRQPTDAETQTLAGLAATLLHA